MKKIVIFGSTGNIGAYFTDYCNNMIDKKQYEVIAVGRKHTDYYKKAGIEYINVDLCNASDFERLPTEDLYAVVNLAGLLPAYMKEYDPFKYVETNINGALRILEYARKNNADRLYILRHGQSRQDIGEKKMFFILSIQENCCLPVIMHFMLLQKV